MRAARARILLLHSHYEGYAWSDSVSAGVVRVLRGSGEPMDLSIAYLDSRRRLDPDYVDAFRRYLDLRFLGQRLDLVLASDNEALAFLASYPGGGVVSAAPVVFCGINDYRPSLIEGLPESTGITEEIAMLETVEATLALPTALILDELIGNALAHAFPEGRKGTVTVRATAEGRDMAIRVADDGVGLPSGTDPYSSETLGFLIVRSLGDQLGGDVSFRPGGIGFEACVRFAAGGGG